MPSVVTSLANGRTLEGLAYFSVLDDLPYSLDSPIWTNAEYWVLNGWDNIPVRGELDFLVKLEMLEISDNIPVHGSLAGGLAGYDWITRGM